MEVEGQDGVGAGRGSQGGLTQCAFGFLPHSARALGVAGSGEEGICLSAHLGPFYIPRVPCQVPDSKNSPSGNVCSV